MHWQEGRRYLCAGWLYFPNICDHPAETPSPTLEACQIASGFPIYGRKYVLPRPSGGFLKWGYPQVNNSNKILPHKPSMSGSPPFMESPSPEKGPWAAATKIAPAPHRSLESMGPGEGKVVQPFWPFNDWMCYQFISCLDGNTTWFTFYEYIYM